KEEVGPDDVADVVSAWTGIPAGRLLEGETGKLLRMEAELGKRLIGQSRAVTAVSDAVRRSRAGISDPDQPSGSFLFLGPTGVGKTELAKALAEFLFDDGRLTDGQGRTVDFRNTILILTSNIGSAFIADPALDDEAKRDAVMNVVRTTFKPEFLNRLDDIILFDALSTEELSQIVDLQVAALDRRLADRRLTLHVTPAAREWLVLTGFDPIYGARPLRRLVQSAIG